MEGSSRVRGLRLRRKEDIKAKEQQVKLDASNLIASAGFLAHSMSDEDGSGHVLAKEECCSATGPTSSNVRPSNCCSFKHCCNTTQGTNKTIVARH